MPKSSDKLPERVVNILCIQKMTGVAHDHGVKSPEGIARMRLGIEWGKGLPPPRGCGEGS